MRKIIAGVVTIVAVTLGTSTAFAAEKHPPKFGVHDTQCSSGANQPHCPGNH